MFDAINYACFMVSTKLIISGSGSLLDKFCDIFKLNFDLKVMVLFRKVMTLRVSWKELTN